jgi:hypothetical protein
LVIDIGILGGLSSQLLAIGGVCGGVYWICKKIFAVENKLAEHDKCIDDSLEERMILLRAQKAALEAISGKRCNGNVDDSITEIDDYLINKAHEE